VKPYYEDGAVTLYHGDCREVLPSLGALWADALVTDPPYGVKWLGTGNRTNNLGGIAGDDGSLDVAAVLSTSARSVRHYRHLYAFGRWALAPEVVSRTCELIWDKMQPSPGGDPWSPQHEYLTFGVRLHRPSDRERSGDRSEGLLRLRRGTVLRYPRLNSAQCARHPSEKPVPLLRDLVEMSTRPGETVLDPFAGVGSTGVAAVMEGRKAVLIELEERYCEVAVERLRRVQAMLPLFKEAAG
jgi:DNA modification methylase